MWKSEASSEESPTKEELQFIPKSFLIKYCSDKLRYWEELLPKHLKNDYDIQQFFICYKHPVNSANDSDQIDLPYFIRNSCRYCKEEEITLSSSMEESNKETKSILDYACCDCSCSIKNVSFN